MTSAPLVVERKRRTDRSRGWILFCLYFQIIVQSGRHPTVLQKLCQLPFQYFSDPRLIKVLFPSLIAACYNNPQNKIILEQEMSCVLLATFIQVRLCSPLLSGWGSSLHWDKQTALKCIQILYSSSQTTDDTCPWGILSHWQVTEWFRFSLFVQDPVCIQVSGCTGKMWCRS